MCSKVGRVKESGKKEEEEDQEEELTDIDLRVDIHKKYFTDHSTMNKEEEKPAKGNKTGAKELTKQISIQSRINRIGCPERSIVFYSISSASLILPLEDT
ncbi:hypothetical protein E2C01_079341 [Portunus trituberculatus]|uniref:Uncharacterized protein n=1 Tax=Portunus trituberculatus TaxID=210409 RepID=A0A5B7IVC7_PORTR|nr:hypothetical protein [Portunus trituberculatus]